MRNSKKKYVGSHQTWATNVVVTLMVLIVQVIRKKTPPLSANSLKMVSNPDSDHVIFIEIAI